MLFLLVSLKKHTHTLTKGFVMSEHVMVQTYQQVSVLYILYHDVNLSLSSNLCMPLPLIRIMQESFLKYFLVTAVTCQ